MNSNVNNILINNALCVLCTCKNDMPNSSLMQYICDSRCLRIYMLTLKESKKYQNIITNPNVSVLIDTRDSFNNPTKPIKAVTLFGEAVIIVDTAISGKLIDQLVKKHGNLATLASNINVCVIEFSIKSYLFLESPEKSSYIILSGN